MQAFLHFDRSVMTHINHVLQDKQRLRKRTQLKRTSYKVLGQSAAAAAAKKMALEDATEEHKVKEYDREIFDDDDFYHQVIHCNLIVTPSSLDKLMPKNVCSSATKRTY